MAKNEVNEKIEPIVLQDTETGMEYTLEFNRDSVKFAEARGFSIDKVSDAPMTYVPDLFFYAFRMHHKNISREKTDRMLFEDLGGMPDGMIERLGMLYALPYDALTQSEEKSKNAKLKVIF